MLLMLLLLVMMMLMMAITIIIIIIVFDSTKLHRRPLRLATASPNSSWKVSERGHGLFCLIVFVAP